MMDSLILNCKAYPEDKLFVTKGGDTIIRIDINDDGELPIDLTECEARRLYDYLGEWLAARQNTGLGDK